MNNEPIKADLEKNMSRREEQRYQELKRTIVNTISASFFEVGKALDEIKRDLLYRQEFRTFEQCCQNLFDIGRHRAAQLIEASAVYDDLLTICQQTQDGESEIIIDVMPVNESQIRPLLKVPAVDRPKLWKEAVEASPKFKPSSGIVNKVVKNYLGEETKNKIRTAQARVDESRKMDAETKSLFQQLYDKISTIRHEGYQITSRIALCFHLDAARRIIAEDGDMLHENKIERSNREKLMMAGYAFIRIDRNNCCIMIEDRTKLDWHMLVMCNPDFIDLEFAKLLKENDKYLAD